MGLRQKLFLHVIMKSLELAVNVAETTDIVMAISFVDRVSAGKQRQTNSQTQTRVLQDLAFIYQPTFIRDQFKAL